MKKLIIILFFLLLPFSAWAGGVMMLGGGGGGEVAACTDANPIGNCTGFTVCQNFQTADTGFDNGEVWVTEAVDGGVVNPAYTTDPIRQTQSIYMSSAWPNDATYGSYAIVDKFSDNNGIYTWYGFLRVKFKTLPDPAYVNTEFFQTYNAFGPLIDQDIEWHFSLFVNEDSHMKVVLKSEPAWGVNGTTDIVANTTYYIWLYANVDASLVSDGWMKLSTTPTIPVGNEVEWSGRDMTDGIARRGINILGVTTLHTLTYSFVVDQILIKTSAIGSVCP